MDGSPKGLQPCKVGFVGTHAPHAKSSGTPKSAQRLRPQRHGGAPKPDPKGARSPRPTALVELLNVLEVPDAPQAAAAVTSPPGTSPTIDREESAAPPKATSPPAPAGSGAAAPAAAGPGDAAPTAVALGGSAMCHALLALLQGLPVPEDEGGEGPPDGDAGDEDRLAHVRWPVLQKKTASVATFVQNKVLGSDPTARNSLQRLLSQSFSRSKSSGLIAGLPKSAQLPSGGSAAQLSASTSSRASAAPLGASLASASRGSAAQLGAERVDSVHSLEDLVAGAEDPVDAASPGTAAARAKRLGGGFGGLASLVANASFSSLHSKGEGRGEAAKGEDPGIDSPRPATSPRPGPGSFVAKRPVKAQGLGRIAQLVRNASSSFFVGKAAAAAPAPATGAAPPPDPGPDAPSPGRSPRQGTPRAKGPAQAQDLGRLAQLAANASFSMKDRAAPQPEEACAEVPWRAPPVVPAFCIAARMMGKK